MPQTTRARNMNRRRNLAGVRRQPQRREGVVLLVVIFVLAMVSAAGALALRSSRNQSTQAGNHRLAVQTQYLNEAVLLDVLTHIKRDGDWSTRDKQGPASFNMFQEFGASDLTGTQDGHVVDSGNLEASRQTAPAAPIVESPLWIDPTSLDPASPDPTGTTGPSTPWSPSNTNALGRVSIVIHAIDCRTEIAVAAGAAATATGSIPTATDPAETCLLEARVRTAVAASPIRANWPNIAGQTGTYPQLSHAIERMGVGKVTY